MEEALRQRPRIWSPISDLKGVFAGGGNPVDGLRGICIGMVVFFHCFFILKVALPKTAFLTFVSDLPFLARIGFNFDKAVDIFFVVSGYLIGAALLREKLANHRVNFLDFYRRRFYRIMPLFWLAMLLFGSFAWKGDMASLLGNLFFLENLFPQLTKIVPVGWSLSIEVQFYLVAPLLFLLPVHQIFRTLLALLALTVGIRLSLVFSNPDFYGISPLTYLTSGMSGADLLDTLYYPSWARLSPIVLGLMVPFLILHYSKTIERQKRLLMFISATCLTFGFLFPSYESEVVVYPLAQALGIAFDRVAVGLGVAILIVCWELNHLSPVTTTQRFLSHWALAMWGRLVYPIYLFHLPFIAVAFLIVFQTTKPANIREASIFEVLMAFPLAMLLTLVLALLLHVVVERPLIRWGRRHETQTIAAESPA